MLTRATKSAFVRLSTSSSSRDVTMKRSVVLDSDLPWVWGQTPWEGSTNRLIVRRGSRARGAVCRAHLMGQSSSCVFCFEEGVNNDHTSTIGTNCSTP